MLGTRPPASERTESILGKQTHVGDMISLGLSRSLDYRLYDCVCVATDRPVDQVLAPVFLELDRHKAKFR